MLRVLKLQRKNALTKTVNIRCRTSIQVLETKRQSMCPQLGKLLLVCHNLKIRKRDTDCET